MLFSTFRLIRGGDTLLTWRIGVFFLGAILGLMGIFLNISWLVTAALVVLLGGVALRMAPARDPGSGDQEPKTPAP